jgi:FkbM family methyltransferase
VTKLTGGPLAALRRWNRRRLERRRFRRELLEALAEDDAAIMSALAQLLEEVRAAGAVRTAALEALAEQVEAISNRQAALAAGLEERGPGADPFPLIRTSREELLEPELSVLALVAPSLSPRLALDVGAHQGRYSRALLDLGFEVHALEPNPAARAELVRRLEGRTGLTVHACAAGAEAGEGSLGLVAGASGRYADPSLFGSLAGLPLPEGLVRAGSVTVPVCRLDALLRERGLPAPSLVKVDAEGTDLDVLRGLGDLWPPVLLAEFWDEALPFSAPGAKNRLQDLVAHARGRGARSHLVVFRRWGDDRPAFFAGWTSPPERSWGNVLFFTERALFEQARQHLATLIPEARFVPAPGP